MRMSMRRKSVVGAVGAVLLAGGLVTAPAVSAEEQSTTPQTVAPEAPYEGELPAPGAGETAETVLRFEEEVPAGTAASAVAAGTPTTTIKTAYCKVTADAPHWSKGAKSVIYKTRVQCFGNIPKVQVKVNGTLVHVSGGGPNVATSSSETQTISTLGGKATFYTPKTTGKKVQYSGTFQGSSSAQIVSPRAGASVAHAASKVVTVKKP